MDYKAVIKEIDKNYKGTAVIITGKKNDKLQRAIVLNGCIDVDADEICNASYWWIYKDTDELAKAHEDGLPNLVLDSYKSVHRYIPLDTYRIEYEGKSYLAADIHSFEDDNDVVIAEEAMDDTLMTEEGDWKDTNARIMDESIFGYLPKEDFSLDAISFVQECKEIFDSKFGIMYNGTYLK